MPDAILDRRVQVTRNNQPEVVRLSELRDAPFLVLLGEPGMGKSTALRREADDEGGTVVTCRELMNGVSVAGQSTAFLDALDEYRTGGDRKDKVLQIAATMTAANLQRWRLTCRAEDWRAAADIAAIQRAAGGGAITVAYLMPLDEEEAESVLAALGETEPRKFVAQANQHGAQAFLESPLSIRLLHKALGGAGGQWPATRFDLFTLAIERLAHEWDPQRIEDIRPSATQIIETAGTLCLYMLATSAAGLWRSNAGLPEDTPDLVPVQQLPVDHALARFTLDTALFKGEGGTFEPIHRTIAEFLAASALARAVHGGQNGAAAFPLSRALALISAPDGKAPSELRGLYAWFAAHLAKIGDQSGAGRLVRADAATVLAYGDAAVFSTRVRSELLHNLDRDDPYFRASTRSGITALGGLAGADLVPEFIAILTRPGKNSDLLLTVYNALEQGHALPALEPTLRTIAFDPKQPVWQRWRAADLLIDYAADADVMRQSVLTQLAGMKVNHDQVTLRLRLTAEMPPAMIPTADIRKLLSDYGHLPKAKRDDDIGTSEFYRLSQQLTDHPRPDLFDAAVLPPFNGKKEVVGNSYALRSLVNSALAAAIRGTPDLTAVRLRQWLRNARESRFDDADQEVSKAIGEWLAVPSRNRDVELARELLATDDPAEGPWVFRYRYTTLTKQEPTAPVFDYVLGQALAAEAGKRRKRLIAIAAHIVHGRGMNPASHWRMLALLEGMKGVKALMEMLISTSLAGWRMKSIRRRAGENDKTAKVKKANVRKLRSALPRIVLGDPREFSALHWGAEAYHQGRADASGGMKSLEALSDETTAAAISEGMVQFTFRGQMDVTVDDMGRIEAKNGSFNVETVTVTGIHRAIATGRIDQLNAAPIVVALVGLRQHWRYEKGSPTVTEWALGRLAADAVAGADILLAYWNAALDAGDLDLDGWHHLDDAKWRELATRAAGQLLRTRPDLPDAALISAIRLVAIHNPQDLASLSAAALSVTLDAKARSTWTFVAMVLDPQAIIAATAEADVTTSLNSVDKDLAKLLQPLAADAIALDAARVRLIGATTEPDPHDWRKSVSNSGLVRAAIQRLGTSPDRAAGDAIRKLMDPASMEPWLPELHHALAEHQRLRRDIEFRRPTIAQITEAMSGGKPASPRDLRAVVVEELRRYQATIRTASTTPWKSYWNTDKNGNATGPRIENECRDRLFELLRTAMEKYQVAESMPEARRGENTRADVLLLSHAGMNMPVEAKRGHNPELWTAPATQLRGYTEDEHAHGYGVYLVFWFGTDYGLPARKDGKASPKTARELEEQLIADLPEDLKETIDIVVLDVSRAANAVPPPPKAKKAGTGPKPAKAKT